MKSAIAMTKKVAIVGGGITRDRAPFDDPSWEIWTTASIARTIPRVTMVWEIHTDEHIKPDTKMDWNCPVKVQHPRLDTPNGEIWQPDHLIALWGKHFSGSMAYMLGEAVYLGFDTIATFGVDMLEPEYLHMREDFLYLIGLFRGMGKDVEVSEGTGMLWPSRAYEYEKGDPLKSYFASKLVYTEETLQTKQEEGRRNLAETEYVRGARDALAQALKMMGV